ncbi:MAG: hypothetical protein MUF18_02520 [Fimbriiglobus sp.]|jgi:hypothetical protein|nr:hypothetical protein [Fimbriiglobus sp.]
MRVTATALTVAVFMTLSGCQTTTGRSDRDATAKVEAVKKAIQSAAVVKVKAALFAVEGKNYPNLGWNLTEKEERDKLHDLVPEATVSDKQGRISSAPYFTIEVYAKEGQKVPDHTFGVVKGHLILVTGTDETVMLDAGDQKLFDHLVEVGSKHASSDKK